MRNRGRIIFSAGLVLTPLCVTALTRPTLAAEGSDGAAIRVIGLRHTGYTLKLRKEGSRILPVEWKGFDPAGDYLTVSFRVEADCGEGELEGLSVATEQEPDPVTSVRPPLGAHSWGTGFRYIRAFQLERLIEKCRQSDGLSEEQDAWIRIRARCSGNRLLERKRVIRAHVSCQDRSSDREQSQTKRAVAERQQP